MPNLFKIVFNIFVIKNYNFKITLLKICGSWNYLIVAISSLIFSVCCKTYQLNLISEELVKYYPKVYFAVSVFLLFTLMIVLWFFISVLVYKLLLGMVAFIKIKKTFSVPYLILPISLTVSPIYAVQLFVALMFVALIIIMLVEKNIWNNKLFSKDFFAFIIILIFNIIIFHKLFIKDSLVFGRSDLATLWFNFSTTKTLQYPLWNSDLFLGSIPNYFFPAAHSLGLYFLTIALDIPSVDILSQIWCVQILIFIGIITGTYSMYLFLRKILNIDYVLALFGGMIYLISNATFIGFVLGENIVHLYVCILLPVFLFLFSKAVSSGKTYDFIKYSIYFGLIMLVMFSHPNTQQEFFIFMFIYSLILLCLAFSWKSILNYFLFYFVIMSFSAFYFVPIFCAKVNKEIILNSYDVTGIGWGVQKSMAEYMRCLINPFAIHPDPTAWIANILNVGLIQLILVLILALYVIFKLLCKKSRFNKYEIIFVFFSLYYLYYDYMGNSASSLINKLYKYIGVYIHYESRMTWLMSACILIGAMLGIDAIVKFLRGVINNKAEYVKYLLLLLIFAQVYVYQASPVADAFTYNSFRTSFKHYQNRHGKILPVLRHEVRNNEARFDPASAALLNAYKKSNLIRMQINALERVESLYMGDIANSQDVILKYMNDTKEISILTDASDANKLTTLCPYATDVHQVYGHDGQLMPNHRNLFRWNDDINYYFKKYDELFKDGKLTDAVDKNMGALNVSGIDYLVAVEGGYVPTKLKLISRMEGKNNLLYKNDDSYGKWFLGRQSDSAANILTIKPVENHKNTNIDAIILGNFATFKLNGNYNDLWLVYNDAWMKDWVAYIGKDKINIEKVNLAFKGLKINGTSNPFIWMEYRPKIFYILSFMLLVIIGIYLCCEEWKISTKKI